MLCVKLTSGCRAISMRFRCKFPIDTRSIRLKGATHEGGFYYEKNKRKKKRKGKTKKRKQERKRGIKLENKKIERADMIRIVMNWHVFCLASLKWSKGLNHSKTPHRNISGRDTLYERQIVILSKSISFRFRQGREGDFLGLQYFAHNQSKILERDPRARSSGPESGSAFHLRPSHLHTRLKASEAKIDGRLLGYLCRA